MLTYRCVYMPEVCVCLSVCVHIDAYVFEYIIHVHKGQQLYVYAVAHTVKALTNALAPALR